MFWKCIKGMFSGKKVWDVVLEDKQAEALEIISANFYWFCMFVGMGGILVYLCGYKKATRITTCAIVFYWVVAALCYARK